MFARVLFATKPARWNNRASEDVTVDDRAPSIPGDAILAFDIELLNVTP